MHCSTIYHKIQTFFFGFSTPANPRAEKRDPYKGFFPVMKDYLHHHTSNWFKEYKWQVGNPIRYMGMMEFGGPIKAYIQSKLHPTHCRINAYNVFSIFVEHSTRKDDIKNSSNFRDLMRQQEGVDKFKELIDKVLQSKEKGLACFCNLGVRRLLFHAFVIEVAPGGCCYIYQSYINEYTLETCLQKMVPLTVDELINQLRRITYDDYNYKHDRKSSKEAEDAFKKLFFTDLGYSSKKDFYFTPVEYSIGSIPIVPRVPSFAERIESVWKLFTTNLSNALKPCH